MAPGVQAESGRALWATQPEVLVWTPKCGAALVEVALGKPDVLGGEMVMLQPLKPRTKMAIRARIDRYFIDACSFIQIAVQAKQRQSDVLAGLLLLSNSRSCQSCPSACQHAHQSRFAGASASLYL